MSFSPSGLRRLPHPSGSSPRLMAKFPGSSCGIIQNQSHTRQLSSQIGRGSRHQLASNKVPPTSCRSHLTVHAYTSYTSTSTPTPQLGRDPSTLKDFVSSADFPVLDDFLHNIPLLDDLSSFHSDREDSSLTSSCSITSCSDVTSTSDVTSSSRSDESGSSRSRRKSRRESVTSTSGSKETQRSRKPSGAGGRVSYCTVGEQGVSTSHGGSASSSNGNIVSFSDGDRASFSDGNSAPASDADRPVESQYLLSRLLRDDSSLSSGAAPAAHNGNGFSRTGFSFPHGGNGNAAPASTHSRANPHPQQQQQNSHNSPGLSDRNTSTRPAPGQRDGNSGTPGFNQTGATTSSSRSSNSSSRPRPGATPRSSKLGGGSWSLIQDEDAAEVPCPGCSGRGHLGCACLQTRGTSGTSGGAFTGSCSRCQGSGQVACRWCQSRGVVMASLQELISLGDPVLASASTSMPRRGSREPRALSLEHKDMLVESLVDRQLQRKKEQQQQENIQWDRMEREGIEVEESEREGRKGRRGRRTPLSREEQEKMTAAKREKREMFSALARQRWSDPEIREKSQAAMLRGYIEKNAPQRIAESMRAYYADEENRKKKSLLMTGRVFRCKACGQEGHRSNFCPAMGFVPAQRKKGRRVNAQSREEQSTEELSAGDQSTEGHLTEDQLAEDQSTEGHLTVDQFADDQSTEGHLTEDQLAEDQSTEGHLTEDQLAEKQSTEDQAMEGRFLLNASEMTPDYKHGAHASPERGSGADENNLKRSVAEFGDVRAWMSAVSQQRRRRRRRCGLCRAEGLTRRRSCPHLDS